MFKVTRTTYFTPYSSVSIVNFKQVITGWANAHISVVTTGIKEAYKKH